VNITRIIDRVAVKSVPWEKRDIETQRQQLFEMRVLDRNVLDAVRGKVKVEMRAEKGKKSERQMWLEAIPRWEMEIEKAQKEADEYAESMGIPDKVRKEMRL
jgi:hypothetical protein